MENNSNNKRNTIILTILGAVTLLATIIGATFAYFTITGNSSTTPTTITGTTENTGSIALTNPNPSMHINLSSSDMSFDKKGTSYYATTDENQDYDTTGTNRNIAVATVTGGGEATKYECTANLTISVSGTMKEHLVNGDGKITLTPTTNVDLGEELEFDLTTFTENKVLPVTYKITGPTTESIGLQMQINNTEAPQDDIAGKEISITVTNSNFNCETVEEFTPKGFKGTDIVAQAPANLNTTLEGGLYRYQGTAAAVTNNYICFGTSDKATCTGDHDKYMYRIIGINSSGQFKLIKKEALNTAYYWHNNYNTNTTWNNSDLYKGLNGISGGAYSNLFIGNTTYIPNETWKNKIADTSWKYGDNTNVNQTASALYNVENGWSTTISAKIGLMYAHDYAYSLKSGGMNCDYNAGQYATCKTSWLFLTASDSAAPQPHEWPMSRYGYDSPVYRAWGVHSDGYVANFYLSNQYSVRPVFYLKSTEIVNGTGTITDPYIISS